MPAQLAYKIVERTEDGYRTLFHGVKGDRGLPVGPWLEAEVKRVRDGGGRWSHWYRSGWHTIPTRQQAEKYMANFAERPEGVELMVVPVEIKGDVRPKEHARSPVLLSRYVRILPEEE